MSTRILFISVHDIWGSKETFSPMLKILNYLANKNYKIDFINIEKTNIFDESSQIYGNPIEFIHENIRINRLRIGSPILLKILYKTPYLNRIIKKIRLQYFFPRKVYKLFKDNTSGYDLIYAYEIYAIKVARRLSTENNKPLVTRFQGTFLLDWYKRNSYSFFYRKYRLHIDALSTPAELIVMTDDGTQGDKALKMLRNNSRIEFLKNGVDFRKLDGNKCDLRKMLGIPVDKFITISVARLTKWKRHERIIYAYEELIKKNKNFVHLFVGDGEERDFLENECRKRNLKDNLIFIGQLNHDKVREYLFCADLFISLFDSTNIGNPLQEAIKMELPIITYDVGDTYKLIQDGYNGTLLNDITPIGVSNAILKIAEDFSYKETLVKGVKETSKRLWSWEDRLGYEEKTIRKIIEDNKYAKSQQEDRQVYKKN